jgi:metacaspase-1
MPIGASLHIGLNAVDPKQYSGWDGQLTACEFDANDMQALAKTQGFAKVTKRLTKRATRNRILADIKAAAAKLKRNDIFLLTYSGHGGQVPNTGSDFEPDGYDETWCLYDGELIDDELYAALKQFVRGVRIFVLSDSCHSGTVLRAAHFSALGLAPVRPRMMPRDIALRVYMDHEKFYDKLQQRRATRRTRMNATAFLISGCQDNQTSADGDRNGLFTETLLAVWKNGKFKGDYRGFHQSIVKLMPPTQSPNYFTIGRTNETFESQKPFTI